MVARLFGVQTQAHAQLGHIGRRQPASKEEKDLHQTVVACSGTDGFQMVDVLHNALMEQGLADIAGKARHTGNGRRTHHEYGPQPGLVVSGKATDLVEVQGVAAQVHHAGGHKQHQLDEGVVHHMEHRAPGGQGILLPQQALHGHTHQDKADLGHGGAGQGPLEVDGKYRQNGAAQHGHHAQH